MLHMNLPNQGGRPLIRLAGPPYSDGLIGAITITYLAGGVREAFREKTVCLTWDKQGSEGVGGVNPIPKCLKYPCLGPKVAIHRVTSLFKKGGGSFR